MRLSTSEDSDQETVAGSGYTPARWAVRVVPGRLRRSLKDEKSYSGALSLRKVSDQCVRAVSHHRPERECRAIYVGREERGSMVRSSELHTTYERSATRTIVEARTSMSSPSSQSPLRHTDGFCTGTFIVD